jgi:ATP-binding cassette, subfamily F, member 2
MTGRKKLTYYDGNYDQFVKTKNEKNENQMKQYLLEQEQIASVKALIAGTVQGKGIAKDDQGWIDRKAGGGQAVKL